MLVSWAVPKGLSTDPRDRRLAIQTEDHPLDYIDFERIIPEGEYGAGTVLLWDAGIYRNLRSNKGRDCQSMENSLGDGLIEVWLQGEKLQGGYALKRIQGGNKPRWLVIKMDDEHSEASRHAAYFDIDCQPVSRGLRNKALPFLGDHYGTVPENGELQLGFDEENGSFDVRYYEHLFPIDPRTYPQIIAPEADDDLAGRSGAKRPFFLFVERSSLAMSICRQTGLWTVPPATKWHSC